MECFWNPQDEQIPKLSLVNQFDQDLKKKTGEKDVHFLMTSTVKFLTRIVFH